MKAAAGARFWILALLLVWSLAVRAWFGTERLDAGRFWDERFGLANIARVLDTGSLAPANVYHPSLSYLPQTALLAASDALFRLTGKEIFAVRDGPPGTPGGKGFSPTAYLLCRWLQAVAGTLGLWVLFLIGRRVFDPAVALTAVLLLSVVPWHIRQSAIYKPDIVLLLTSLLAFLWTLRAVENERFRAFLLAGLGVGLALASKYNAAPIAVPLVLGSLVGPSRSGGSTDRRRHLVHLAAALAVGAAVLLLLNPWLLSSPELFEKDFGNTLQHYERLSDALGGTRAGMVVHAGSSLLSPPFHGPAIGGLAFAGFFGLAVVLIAGKGDRGRRLRWGMFLSYPAAYVIAYAAATTNPSPHNWLPLAPFSALAAAWVLVSVGRWVASKWDVLQHSTAGLLAIGALAGVLLPPATAYTYREVVPSSRERVEAFLRQRLSDVERRTVYFEDGHGWLRIKRRNRRAAVVLPERLDQLAPETLAAADVEIFAARHLDGEKASFYKGRIESGAAIHRFDRGFFAAWGPPLVLVFHPWESAGEPIDLPWEILPDGAIRARLPAATEAGEVASFEVGIEGRQRPRIVREFRVGERVLPLTSTGIRWGVQGLLSPRFSLAAEPGEVRIRFAGEEQPQRLRIFFWRKAATGAGA